MDDKTNLPAPTTSDIDIELELKKAELEAKRQRRSKIGSLLDKATDVLAEVLEGDDPNKENLRMRAAEVAVNLYMQSSDGERQDKNLEMQQRKLELEEAKLKAPGGMLFQQNNYYVNGSQQQKTPEQIEAEKAQLTERKHEQAELLEQYLPPELQGDDEE